MSEAPADRPEPEVVDAEVVPDDTTASRESSSAEVAVVEAAGKATGVLMPYDADEVKTAMTAYQQAVAAVLDESDWQNAGRGERFIKKSGWRKIAKAFGLSVSRVESGVERDSEGNPVRAFAVFRATAPNGQSQDGDGYCSVDESRFQKDSGRKKLENDMRATATTRAKNRAISDLVGMGEVSAEEVELGGGGSGSGQLEAYSGDMGPVWGEIVRLIGNGRTAALSDFLLKEGGGKITQPVGRTLAALTRLTKQSGVRPGMPEQSDLQPATGAAPASQPEQQPQEDTTPPPADPKMVEDAQRFGEDVPF